MVAEVTMKVPAWKKNCEASDKYIQSLSLIFPTESHFYFSSHQHKAIWSRAECSHLLKCVRNISCVLRKRSEEFSPESNLTVPSHVDLLPPFPLCHIESVKCSCSMWKERKALPVCVCVCFSFMVLVWWWSWLTLGALSVPNLHSITPLQCSPHIWRAELNGGGGSRSSKPSTELADLWLIPLISQDPPGIHTGPD